MLGRYSLISLTALLIRCVWAWAASWCPMHINMCGALLLLRDKISDSTTLWSSSRLISWLSKLDASLAVGWPPSTITARLVSKTWCRLSSSSIPDCQSGNKIESQSAIVLHRNAILLEARTFSLALFCPTWSAGSIMHTAFLKDFGLLMSQFNSSLLLTIFSKGVVPHVRHCLFSWSLAISLDRRLGEVRSRRKWPISAWIVAGLFAVLHSQWVFLRQLFIFV